MENAAKFNGVTEEVGKVREEYRGVDVFEDLQGEPQYAAFLPVCPIHTDATIYLDRKQLEGRPRLPVLLIAG